MAYRHSAAARDLIRQSNIRNNPRTNASRAEKVRAFQLGRPKSDEWKRKIANGVKASWAARRALARGSTVDRDHQYGSVV